MATPKPAIDFVLQNEGGFVDNPDDSGGATMAGLSLRFLEGLGTVRLSFYGLRDPISIEDLKSLSAGQIESIYQKEIWGSYGFDAIRDQSIANYVFDCCVNHGREEGIKILQRALWSCHDRTCVLDDGVLGQGTLMHTNSPNASAGLIYSLPAERAGLMRLIAKCNSKDEEFLNGWLNRAYRI